MRNASLMKVGRRDLRRRNKWLLLHLIQAGGPSSRAQLARSSGLSPATVSGILQPLVDSQVVVEEGKTLSGIGRRAAVLAFNQRTCLTAGVVVEQEECEVALVDLSARVIDRVSFKYPRDAGPLEVVERLAGRLSALAERNHVDAESLMGIGVAIPGLVDSDSGLVYVATNLGWHNVQLRALFEQKTGLRTRIEHLGRAKARAEATWGKGVGHKNFVCLEIGSGIGAGVMLDGYILSGANASAGEVGHTSMDIRGPRCGCGMNGCWETFCSSPAIRRLLLECLASPDGAGSRLSTGSTLAEMSDACEQGDPVARRVLDETANYLARGICSVVWNFDPEIVILSGAVVRDWPCLIQATRAKLSAFGTVRKLDVPLVAATKETDSGVIAASAQILLAVIEELSSAEMAVPAEVRAPMLVGR